MMTKNGGRKKRQCMKTNKKTLTKMDTRQRDTEKEQQTQSNRERGREDERQRMRDVGEGWIYKRNNERKHSHGHEKKNIYLEYTDLEITQPHQPANEKKKI